MSGRTRRYTSAITFTTLPSTGACLGLSVQEIAPQGILAVDGYCAGLPPLGSFRAGARFVATTRGKITWRPCESARDFRLGWSMAGGSGRWKARACLASAGGSSGNCCRGRGADLDGAPSPVTGGQDEFFGLREYRPTTTAAGFTGDDPPAERFRSSARWPSPSPDRSGSSWTRTAPGHAGKPGVREQTIRFAATLIDYAFERGYRVGLATSFDAGPTVSRPRAAPAIVRRS